MVCTANDLQGWKDFPKGLRVLLLDGDSSSAADIRSKLEEMEYVVHTYCDENEALSAISSKCEIFHVAIVEVNATNSEASFKFLEATKDLPTVMTSNFDCLNTMMKCIALGAVEFLRKPLSEDKLRNIWQHVVHKAFNTGSGLSGSLKPIKESVSSMLQLKLVKGESESNLSVEMELTSPIQDNDRVYPAPSTPQLEQGARSVDDGDCQDGESKSVEITQGSSLEGTLHAGQPPISERKVVQEEEEEDSANGCKGVDSIPRHSYDRDCLSNTDGGAENKCKTFGVTNTCGPRANRKKTKVDWTPGLHKKFVKAVEQLGVDQAIPSRILELMKVEGLTRHNVASHLQKYRMHKRQILPKEDDPRWLHQRDPTRKGYNSQKPIMAFPPYYSNHALPVAPIYPVWGQPGGHPAGPMWSSHGYPLWQSPDNSWHRKTYPGIQADAWGCPVIPPPQSHYSSHPQNVSGYQSSYEVYNGFGITHTSFDLQPAEEVIDKVVKEAMSKPWLPLPLGLKPPSTESVLSELSRQGISTIPSHIKGSKQRGRGTRIVAPITNLS